MAQALPSLFDSMRLWFVERGLGRSAYPFGQLASPRFKAGEMQAVTFFVEHGHVQLWHVLQDVAGPQCVVCPRVAASALVGRSDRPLTTDWSSHHAALSAIVLDFVVCVRWSGQALCVVQVESPDTLVPDLLRRVLDRGPLPLVIVPERSAYHAADIRQLFDLAVRSRQSLR